MVERNVRVWDAHGTQGAQTGWDESWDSEGAEGVKKWDLANG